MAGKSTVDADRVRELLRQGVAQKHVAERLGVSKSVVCVIAREMRKAGGA